MTTTTAVPIHLAVHLLGLAVCVALVALAVTRRRESGPGWLGIALGASLLATSHVLTGALVTADLAWPVYLRIAGYAAIAVGGAGGLLGGTAVIAVPIMLPAAARGTHVLAGVAGLAAAVAWARGVLGRSGVPFAIGLGLWAASDAIGEAVAVPAAVLSVAGSLAVAWWMLDRTRTSLLTRVAATYGGAVLVVVLALASLGGAVLGADLERDELARLDSVAGAHVVEVARDWPAELLTVTELFAQDALARALEDGDAERLEGLARSIARLPGVDLTVLLTGDGRVAASYEWIIEPAGSLPSSDALAIAGDDVLADALEGGTSTGLVAMGARGPVAVGASPVFPTEDGELRRDRQAGVLMVGRRTADPVFLEEVQAASDAGVTIVVDGSVAGSTLPDAAAADLARTVAPDVSTAIVEVDGRSTFVAAAPLGTSDGDDAVLVLSRDATALAGAEQRFTRALYLIAAAGLAVALVLATWVARRTTRPLLALTAAAERIAGGDLHVETGIEQPDEVGRLAGSFDQMTASLRRREAELHQAARVETDLRQRLQVMTTSMEEALIAVDADGRIQTVNPAATRLLELGAEAARGAPVREVLIGADRSGTALLDALGGPRSTEVRAARGTLTGGSRRTPIAATAAPLRADEGLVGRVYVLRDTTAETEAERMKTEFLANISHELRTPLTPIRGYAEVLKHKELPTERVREFADNIAIATGQLERIVGMLLDFAALEAGRLEVRAEPTDLDAVVSEVLARRRQRHPERRFSRYLASDLPPVLADEALLGRLLEELIDNAVKFSDGPVRIRAAAGPPGDRAGEPADAAGATTQRHVRLTVRDEGVGIDDEEVAAITQDFRQIDGGSTRQYGGLGLGLSLVSRIARRFGAELIVRSERDVGTEVDVLLPVAEGTTR